MVVKPFTVDLDKPLVFQVGHLGKGYNEWVHQPIVSKEGPRFFANDYLELLTRTTWWVIPLVWLPVASWLVSVSLRMGLTLPQAALAVVGGIFIWTLMEYVIHRFPLHMKTISYWGNTIHYLFHGCHHKHPMDRMHLVFPPAVTAILCVPFWNMFRLLSPPSVAPALFGGTVFGYVAYDVTHYFLHHGKPSNRLTQDMKVGHLGEAYQEWVHQPIVCTGSPRFFDNEIIEFLPYMASSCVLLNLHVLSDGPFFSWNSSDGSSLGIFVWTLLEYVLHRFLFHIETKSYWGNTMHYYLHGSHHKHPLDELRLVFPPALTAIFSLIFWNMVRLLSPPSVAPALFGGILLGYITYDVTHYYLHHGKPSKRLTQEISLEPSLQKSKQGIWGHFLLMGQSFRNIVFNKSFQENE